jgi:hypothetical protein
MVAAIERETTLAERRRVLPADAVAARDQIVGSGRGSPAGAVHRYVAARVRGK